MRTEDVRQLLAIVQALPEERAREVLDFALFIQSRISLNDSARDAIIEATDDAGVQKWIDELG